MTVAIASSTVCASPFDDRNSVSVWVAAVGAFWHCGFSPRHATAAYGWPINVGIVGACVLFMGEV